MNQQPLKRSEALSGPPRARTSPERLPEGLTLDEYIDRLAEELHQRVEHQRNVVKQLLCEANPGSSCVAYCPLVDCPRLEKLRGALRDTVSVLEETKSSFKSKRLGVMRQKLLDILAGG